MKAFHVLAIGAVTVSVGTIAAIGHAEVYSVPGLVCVEDNDVLPELRYSFGNAFNTGSAAETFNCAMLRRAPDTANITDVAIVVNDQHTASGVECVARSCNSGGTSCSSSTILASASTGIQTLSLGSVGAFSSGYAYIRCTVPGVNAGQSGVMSYRWND